MSYEISPARSEEEAALCALFEAYYEELRALGMNYALNRDKLPEVIRSRIRSRMFTFPVARTEEGEIAGFLMGSVHRLGGEYLSEGSAAVGFLHEMYVLPAHRRRGLAQRLLRALEDWLRAQNVSALELHVLEQNQGARALYLAEGFRPIASILTKTLDGKET